MEGSLEFIDRFIRIITSSDSKNNERLYSEWTYLHTLLKSQPLSQDRIEAYLNILESHDSAARRNLTRAKKSLTEHPNAKTLLACIDETAALFEPLDDKLKLIDRR